MARMLSVIDLWTFCSAKNSPDGNINVMAKIAETKLLLDPIDCFNSLISYFL